MTKDKRVKRWKRSIVVLTVALLLICAVVFLISTDVFATSDAVGSWHMEEGSGTLVADGSGSGNDGTLNDASAWVAGDSPCGNHIHFDGTTVVTVPSAASLAPAHVTVQAMVKANGTPGQYRYIASKNLGTGWASYALYTGGTGGLVFYVGNAATFTLSPAATHTTVWDGEWHHIVGTYDGTQVRLYFDGSLAGVTATSIGIGYNSEEFEIGDNRLGPVFEHHFVGEIDAVKVWNRALTPTEIAQFDPCTPDTPPNTPPSASAGGSA